MADHNTLKHVFTSAVPDDPDASLVRPSNWNKEHVFSGGSNGQYLKYDGTQTDNVAWGNVWSDFTVIDITKAPYLAVGDGVSDSSAAFAAALATGQPIYVPTGIYYIPTAVELDGVDVVMFGDGIGKSVLLSRAATTPNSGGVPVSYLILSVINSSLVRIRDLTLDGNLASITSYPVTQPNQDYLMALLDIRDSTNIFLDRVNTTKFVHSQGATGPGTWLSPIETALNSGPVFIYNCENIHINACGISSPGFGEGWRLIDVQDLYIDRFTSDAGFPDNNTYGLTSPLTVLGPETENVHITNCVFRNNRGSSIVVGGNHSFWITDNAFLGETATIANPANAGLYAGINMDYAQTVEFWPAHPIMSDIHICRNVFRYNTGLCISVGLPGTTVVDDSTLAGFQQIEITENDIFDCWTGINFQLCYDITVANNKLRKVLAYQAAGNYGEAIIGQFSSNILIDGNTVDGSESVVYDGSNRQCLYDILMNRCQRVTVQNNVLLDASLGNIHVIANTASDLTYGNTVLGNNVIRNITVIPAVIPVKLGTDGTHRLSTATVYGNVVNRLPLNGANFSVFVETVYDGEMAIIGSRATNQSIPNADALTVILCTTSVVNPYTYYNAGTGTYTAQMRGLYEVSFNGLFDTISASSRVQAFVAVNGSVVTGILGQWNNDLGIASAAFGVAGSLIVQLAATNTVTVVVRQNGSGAINFTAGVFSVRYVGRN